MSTFDPVLSCALATLAISAAALQTLLAQRREAMRSVERPASCFERVSSPPARCRKLARYRETVARLEAAGFRQVGHAEDLASADAGRIRCETVLLASDDKVAALARYEAPASVLRRLASWAFGRRPDELTLRCFSALGDYDALTTVPGEPEVLVPDFVDPTVVRFQTREVPFFWPAEQVIGEHRKTLAAVMRNRKSDAQPFACMEEVLERFEGAERQSERRSGDRHGGVSSRPSVDRAGER